MTVTTCPPSVLQPALATRATGDYAALAGTSKHASPFLSLLGTNFFQVKTNPGTENAGDVSL